MKRSISLTIRVLILILGLGLSAFMLWQLVTGSHMLDFNIETQGPVIIVVFSILLLLTLGSAISFFSNRHFSSTIFLGGLLAVAAFILWLLHPEQADIYRWYFIYGLLVGICSPLFLTKNK